MAISIPSGGFDPRSAGLVARRGNAARELEAPAQRSEERERERTGSIEPEADAGAPVPARPVFEGRVQRLGASADTGSTHRGIDRYLEVQQDNPAESFGGELVGIDIYV